MAKAVQKLEKSKFVKAILCLNNKELGSFEQYVSSPFFNKNEKVKALSKYIINGIINNTKIDRYGAYKVVFNEKGYREKRINNLLSDSLNLLEGFFSYLEKDNIFLNESYKLMTSEKEQKNITLATMEKSLNLFWLERKLSIICQMINHNNLLNTSYQWKSIFEDVEKHIKSDENILKENSINIYYLLVKVLSGKDDKKEAEQLRKLIKAHIQLFDHRTQRIIYTYIQNFFLRKFNEGSVSYKEGLFEILKERLKRKLIFSGRTIPFRTFHSYVLIGIRIKEFKWVDGFIKKFEKYLEEENYKYFIRGYYESENIEASVDNRYSIALSYLDKVKVNKDYIIRLGINSIQLRYFFTKNNESTFYKKANTFERWINRNSKIIAVSHKENSKAFIKYTSKLFQLKQERDFMDKNSFQEKMNAIKKQIIKEKMANKEWLLDSLKKMGHISAPHSV